MGPIPAGSNARYRALCNAEFFRNDSLRARTHPNLVHNLIGDFGAMVLLAKGMMNARPAFAAAI
jgi:hypothetical protein